MKYTYKIEFVSGYRRKRKCNIYPKFVLFWLPSVQEVVAHLYQKLNYILYHDCKLVVKLAPGLKSWSEWPNAWREGNFLPLFSVLHPLDTITVLYFFHYSVNPVFSCTFFYRKRPLLHHACATYSDLQSYISSMENIVDTSMLSLIQTCLYKKVTYWL